MGIKVTIWFIGVINLLAESPDPPSSFQGLGSTTEKAWNIVNSEGRIG